MSVIHWILFSFTAVFAVLYIVGFVKNIPLLTHISSALILPLTGSACILFLKYLLPDSLHTITITTASYSAIILAQILFIFNKNKTCVICAKVFYAINIIFWVHLYISAYYIYRVPGLLNILYGIIFVFIAAALCIMNGKQKPQIYFDIIIEIAVVILLNLFALIFLIYGKKINAILLFAGTLINIAFVSFYLLDSKKFNFKFGKPLSLILMIAAQTMISYSNILMLQ